MNDSSMSQGPWRLVPIGGDEAGDDLAIVGADDEVVVEVTVRASSARDRANVAAMTAAPLMIEALRYALPYLQAAVPRPRDGVDGDLQADRNCVRRVIEALAAAGAAP